jgi:hypothetical protein
MKKRFRHLIPSNFSIATAAVVIVFYCACSGNGSEKSNRSVKNSTEAKKTIRKPGSSFRDTLTVATKSVVFYTPDSLQMERIKAVNESTVFESITHDCFFQMKNARLVLKKYWPQINIVETSGVRFLLFIKKNKSRTVIDLDSKNDICGLFLFNTEKDPELADMMNVDTALGFYFNK